MSLTLATANSIITSALAHARGANLKPLSVVVLDAGLRSLPHSLKTGSASCAPPLPTASNGAISLAWGHGPMNSRPIVSAINGVAGGDLVPVPGGVLIKEGDAIIGVIGISGDTSDNDEAAAVAGIEAAGLTAITG